MRRPDVIILTTPGDVHAIAVKWALQKKGVDVESVFLGDLPQALTFSLFLDESSHELVLHDSKGLQLGSGDAKVAWNRRVGFPPAPPDVHESDREVVERMCRAHIENARFMFPPNCCVINEPNVQFAATKKTVQLKAALAAGLSIPKTLITNDFDEVVKFVSLQKSIMKSYTTFTWQAKDANYTSFTTKIDHVSEADRASIEMCPQIYQERIDFVSDVRLIAFGPNKMAIQMRREEGQFDDIADGRLLLHYGASASESIDIPKGIANSIDRYMQSLGLKYGAFDFVIDEGGSWRFLECNESGQFLFLEHFCPDVKILGGVASWLAGLCGIEIDTSDLTFRDFAEAGGEAALEEEVRLHRPVWARPRTFEE